MLTSIRAIVVAISLFGTYASAQEASPVIAKALEAVGGKDKLLKIFRMDEVYHSGESAEVDSNTKRTKRTSIIELPGNWWLGKKERGVEPAKQDVRAWSLDLLIDPKSQIESIGELEDEGKICDGLSISGSVAPAMKLYFDKDTHLLRRLDWRDDFYRFSDWHDHDGLKYAAKTSIFKLKTGKAWFHHEITSIERLSSLPSDLEQPK